MNRVTPLENGEIYHVMNKSIAGYEFFSRTSDYQRFIQMLRFFKLKETPAKYSQFVTSAHVEAEGFKAVVADHAKRVGEQVQIVAYCLMPTHFHIVAKQLSDNGISEWLRRSQNAYARYFNIRYNRQGPLFTGRFKNVHISTDEQLLHTNRYLHLNPVSAGIIEDPKGWPYSSYQEYITPQQVKYPLTSQEGIIGMDPEEYQQFTLSEADTQREREVLKHQLI